MAISRLADFPNLGSVLPDEEYTLVNRGYRFIVVQTYLVFYRIIDHTIIIHRTYPAAGITCASCLS
ncbi:type II toxin-antitoxin system RelE/ParE family toxin [Desulfotruncus arcticus]|uniref:type II toxin-antitoxin system RelE/ParE family toxin n=1 Tax=Desulfotruncus arcticus TaxID=341036 RepID=UPI001A9A375C